jgi:hypothetical protein
MPDFTRPRPLTLQSFPALTGELSPPATTHTVKFDIARALELQLQRRYRWLQQRETGRVNPELLSPVSRRQASNIRAKTYWY